MKTLFFLLPLCTLLHVEPLSLPEQGPEAEKNFFRFGDQLVSLETHGNAAARNYVLLALHGNEAASQEAMLNLSRSTGGYFIRLLNNQKKLIEGSFLDKKIAFDPNSIFTDWGRKEHLKANRCWTKYIDLKVEQFSNFIINEIPYDKAIVSLHAHHATIRQYADQKKLNKQVKDLHRSGKITGAEFFITTDESIYQILKGKDQNVVLLHPKKIVNDGHLAVYCARTKKPYVQIETSNAAGESAQMMLQMIDDILK